MEENIKELWESFGGESVGTLDQFKEFYSDDTARNELYESFGGESVGTMEQFDEFYGFGSWNPSAPENPTQTTPENQQEQTEPIPAEETTVQTPERIDPNAPTQQTQIQQVSTRVEPTITPDKKAEIGHAAYEELKTYDRPMVSTPEGGQDDINAVKDEFVRKTNTATSAKKNLAVALDLELGRDWEQKLGEIPPQIDQIDAQLQELKNNVDSRVDPLSQEQIDEVMAAQEELFAKRQQLTDQFNAVVGTETFKKFQDSANTLKEQYNMYADVFPEESALVKKANEKRARLDDKYENLRQDPNFIERESQVIDRILGDVKGFYNNNVADGLAMMASAADAVGLEKAGRDIRYGYRGISFHKATEDLHKVKASRFEGESMEHQISGRDLPMTTEGFSGQVKIVPDDHVVVYNSAGEPQFMRNKYGTRVDWLQGPPAELRTKEFKDIVKEFGGQDYDLGRIINSARSSMFDFGALILTGRLASKLTGLSTTVTTGTMGGLQAYGDTYHQMMKDGKDPSSSAQIALGTSIIIGLTESLIGPIEARLASLGTGISIRQAVKKPIKELLKRWASGEITRGQVKEGIGVVIKEVAKVNGGEVVEELVQEEGGKWVESLVEGTPIEHTSLSEAINIALPTIATVFVPSLFSGRTAYHSRQADINTTALYHASQNLEMFEQTLIEQHEEDADLDRIEQSLELAEHVANQLETRGELSENQKVGITGMIATKLSLEKRRLNTNNIKLIEKYDKQIEKLDEGIAKVEGVFEEDEEAKKEAPLEDAVDTILSEEDAAKEKGFETEDKGVGEAAIAKEPEDLGAAVDKINEEQDAANDALNDVNDAANEGVNEGVSEETVAEAENIDAVKGKTDALKEEAVDSVPEGQNGPYKKGDVVAPNMIVKDNLSVIDDEFLGDLIEEGLNSRVVKINWTSEKGTSAEVRIVTSEGAQTRTVLLKPAEETTTTKKETQTDEEAKTSTEPKRTDTSSTGTGSVSQDNKTTKEGQEKQSPKTEIDEKSYVNVEESDGQSSEVEVSKEEVEAELVGKNKLIDPKVEIEKAEKAYKDPRSDTQILKDHKSDPTSSAQHVAEIAILEGQKVNKESAKTDGARDVNISFTRGSKQTLDDVVESIHENLTEELQAAIDPRDIKSALQDILNSNESLTALKKKIVAGIRSKVEGTIDGEIAERIENEVDAENSKRVDNAKDAAARKKLKAKKKAEAKEAKTKKKKDEQSSDKTTQQNTGDTKAKVTQDSKQKDESPDIKEVKPRNQKDLFQALKDIFNLPEKQAYIASQLMDRMIASTLPIHLRKNKLAIAQAYGKMIKKMVSAPDVESILSDDVRFAEPGGEITPFQKEYQDKVSKNRLKDPIQEHNRHNEIYYDMLYNKETNKVLKEYYKTYRDLAKDGVLYQNPLNNILNANKPKYTLKLLNEDKRLQNIEGSVSVGILKEIAKTKGQKPIIGQIMNEVLEMEKFQGTKKINYNEFLLEVSDRLLPLTVIKSDSHNSYGMENTGLSIDSKNTKSHIYNTDLEHGIRGHFPGDFPDRKKVISQEEILKQQAVTVYLVRRGGNYADDPSSVMVIQENGTTGERVIQSLDRTKTAYKDDSEFIAALEKYNEEDITKEKVLVGDFYADSEGNLSTDTSIALENHNKQEETINLEIRPLKDNFAVVRSNVVLTQENLAENVLTVTSTQEKAQEYIDNIIKAEYTNKGLFGHTRVWKDNDGNVFVAEIQSDSYQKMRAKELVWKSYVNDPSTMTEEQQKLMKEYEELDKTGMEAYTDFLKSKNDYSRNANYIIGTTNIKRSSSGKYEIFENSTNPEFTSNVFEDVLNHVVSKPSFISVKNRINTLNDLKQEIFDKASIKDKQFIAHEKNHTERLLREEISAAKEAGAKTLSIPTPRTLASIEGFISEDGSMPYEIEDAEDHDILSVGDTIEYLGETYMVVDSDGYNIHITTDDNIEKAHADDLIYNVISQESDNSYSKLISELDSTESITAEQWDDADKGALDGVDIADVADENEDGTYDLDDGEIEEYLNGYWGGIYPNAESYLQDIYGWVETEGDYVYYAGSAPHTETLKQPVEYEAEADVFDIEDFDDEEQTILKKYQKVADKFGKERGGLETWTDERGYEWLRTDLKKEDESPIVVFQDGNTQTPKGAYDLNQRIMYALFNPDVSTPVHELTHAYETILSKEQSEQVYKWVEKLTKGKIKRGEQFPEQVSEFFARGAEQYLKNGDAQNQFHLTKDLKKIFRNFKEWMSDIYDVITQDGVNLEGKLNKDMKAIYNQMFDVEGFEKKGEPKRNKIPRTKATQAANKTTRVIFEGLGLELDGPERTRWELEIQRALDLGYITQGPDAKSRGRELKLARQVLDGELSVSPRDLPAVQAAIANAMSEKNDEIERLQTILSTQNQQDLKAFNEGLGVKDKLNASTISRKINEYMSDVDDLGNALLAIGTQTAQALAFRAHLFEPVKIDANYVIDLFQNQTGEGLTAKQKANAKKLADEYQAELKKYKEMVADRDARIKEAEKELAQKAFSTVRRGGKNKKGKSKTPISPKDLEKFFKDSVGDSGIRFQRDKSKNRVGFIRRYSAQLVESGEVKSLDGLVKWWAEKSKNGKNPITRREVYRAVAYHSAAMRKAANDKLKVELELAKREQDIHNRLEKLLEGRVKSGKVRQFGSARLRAYQNLVAQLKALAHQDITTDEAYLEVVKLFNKLDVAFLKEGKLTKGAVENMLKALRGVKAHREVNSVEKKIKRLEGLLKRLQKGDISAVEEINPPVVNRHINQQVRKQKEKYKYLQERVTHEAEKLAWESKHKLARKIFGGNMSDLIRTFRGPVVMRALKTMADLSMVMTHGAIYNVRAAFSGELLYDKGFRKDWVKVQGTMFHQLWHLMKRLPSKVGAKAGEGRTSREFALEINAALKSDPMYKIAKDAGVDFSIPGGRNFETEEDFQSEFMDKLPVIGKVQSISEDLFVTYINMVRLNSFKSLYESAHAPTENELERIGHFTNLKTGRLSGKSDFDKAFTAKGMDWFLLAPRYAGSRIKLPFSMTKALVIDGPKGLLTTDQASKAISRSVFKTMTGYTAAFLLSTMAGFDWETDCRNSDFMKLKHRDSSVAWDITGGALAIVVAACRGLSGGIHSFNEDIWPLKSTMSTNEIGIKSTIMNFMSYKTNPYLDAIFGIFNLFTIDFMGRPLAPKITTAIGKGVASMVLPIAVEQAVEFIGHDDLYGIAPAVLGFNSTDFDNPLRSQPATNILNDKGFTINFAGRTTYSFLDTIEANHGPFPKEFYKNIFKQKTQQEFGEWVLRYGKSNTLGEIQDKWREVKTSESIRKEVLSEAAKLGFK